jgi:hypothetical protein
MDDALRTSLSWKVTSGRTAAIKAAGEDLAMPLRKGADKAIEVEVEVEVEEEVMAVTPKKSNDKAGRVTPDLPTKSYTTVYKAKNCSVLMEPKDA